MCQNEDEKRNPKNMSMISSHPIHDKGIPSGYRSKHSNPYVISTSLDRKSITSATRSLPPLPAKMLVRDEKGISSISNFGQEELLNEDTKHSSHEESKDSDQDYENQSRTNLCHSIELDRLPSRNVNYTSAEILTVTELAAIFESRGKVDSDDRGNLPDDTTLVNIQKEVKNYTNNINKDDVLAPATLTNAANDTGDTVCSSSTRKSTSSHSLNMKLRNQTSSEKGRYGKRKEDNNLQHAHAQQKAYLATPGASVRITGIIHHIQINHKTGMSWLIIGDPLSKPCKENPYTSTSSSKRRQNQPSSAGKNDSITCAFARQAKQVQSTSTSTPKSTSSTTLITTTPNKRLKFGSSGMIGISPSLLNSGKRQRKLVTVKNHRGAAGLGLVSSHELLRAKRLNGNSGDIHGGIVGSTCGRIRRGKNLQTFKNGNGLNSSLHKKSSLARWNALSENVQNLLREKISTRMPLILIDISGCDSIQGSNENDLLTVVGEVEQCNLKKTDNIEISDSIDNFEQQKVKTYEPVNDSMKINEVKLKPNTVHSPDHKIERNYNTSETEKEKNRIFDKNSQVDEGLQQALSMISQTSPIGKDTINTKIRNKESSNNKTLNQNQISFWYPYLRARILRKSNGTDMNLFQEALYLRRQHLRERMDFMDFVSDINDGLMDKLCGTGPR